MCLPARSAPGETLRGREYPRTTGWRAIPAGGGQGRWRHDGREFYYLTLDGKLMAVDIKASSSSIEPGTPHVLFNTGITGSPVARMNQYLVTRDQRFLINRSAEDENSAPITVVLNWNSTRQ